MKTEFGKYLINSFIFFVLIIISFFRQEFLEIIIASAFCIIFVSLALMSRGEKFYHEKNNLELLDGN